MEIKNSSANIMKVNHEVIEKDEERRQSNCQPLEVLMYTVASPSHASLYVYGHDFFVFPH